MLKFLVSIRIFADLTKYFLLEFTSNVSNHRMYLKFPTNDDLNGAANALVRLQVTYNLDTSSIARGVLNGVKYTYVIDCST